MNKISNSAIALVITANATGLAVIRSLHKEKVKTVALSRKSDLCCYSRLPSKIEILSLDWQADLLQVLKGYENKNCVLIPTADTHLDFIIEHSEYLNSHFTVSATHLSTLTSFVDKSAESNLIKSTDTPLPETVETVNDMTIAELRRPIIFKAKSHGNNVLGVKNIVVSSDHELKQFMTDHSQCLDDVIAQEVIPGGESALWIASCVFNQGELVSFFCYQRISAAPKLYGVTSFAVSRFNTELADLCKNLGSKLDYTGVADIEFKWDERDQIFKYIELNARVGMCAWFDARCGVNTVYNGYLVACERAREIFWSQQKESIYLLSTYQDAYSRLKAGESLKDVLFLYTGYLFKKTVSLFYTFNDPLPGIVCHWRYLSDTLASIKNKLKKPLGIRKEQA